MNHEQHRDESAPRGFEHLPIHQQPGPESEHVIRWTQARLASLDDELRVTEGYLLGGSAFAAFLRLQDIAAEDPMLIHRFQDVYASSRQTMDQLIDDELDALGWTDALAQFRRESGIDQLNLDWNRPALETQLHDVYSIVELDGWLHVFYR